MSLTNQSQETFQSRGILTSGSPGNLGTVAGTFYKYAGGPKTSSDTSANGYGWSADLRLVATTGNEVYHEQSISGAAQTLGCFSSFFFFDSFPIVGSGLFTLIHRIGTSVSIFVAVEIGPNANFWLAPPSAGPSDTGFPVPLRQWFELRCSWAQISGNNFQVLYAYRLAGTSTWVTIQSLSSAAMGASAINQNFGGAYGLSGGSATWRGRYGMPTVCTMGSFSDNTLSLPNVVDPRQTPYTWYVDPINGSDSNDGATFDTAYQTAANLTTLSGAGNNYGFFAGYAGNDWLCKADSTPIASLGTYDANVWGALIAQGQGLTLNAYQVSVLAAAGLSASYAQGIIPNGDKILIADNGGQPWRLDAAITFNTSGIYVGPTSGDIVNCKAYINCSKQVLHGSWSLTSGQTAVWQTTAPYQFSCPLQNGRPLTAESSIANCAANVGSFYADNGSPTATIYVHPFGGLDPTQSANDGMMELTWLYEPILSNAGTLFAGLDITKTVLYNATTGDEEGYCIQLQGSSCINAVLNCNGSRYDKHCFGATATSSTNGRNIWINLNANGGNPYVGFGGQTPFVDYYDNGSGNQAYYDNTNILGGNVMNLGATNYVYSTGEEAYICHGNTETEMSNLFFVNTNFYSPLMLAPSIQQNAVAVSQITLTTGGAAPFIRPGEF